MPAKRKKSTGEPPVTKISRPKRGANKKVNYNVDKVFENIGLGVSTSDGDVGDHHRPLKKSQGQSTKPRKRRK